MGAMAADIPRGGKGHAACGGSFSPALAMLETAGHVYCIRNEVVGPSAEG